MRNQTPGTSPRDLWLNLGLLIISAIIGFGLCETYFRLFAPCRLYGMQYQSPQVHFFTYDDRLGWRGRPGAEGPFGSIDFLVHVRLDRLGNRSSTEPFVAGKENVLVLGDSYGWGWGVENREVFSEAMMRGNPGLNVYNLSAPGYGTGQQYLQLARFLENRPDQSYDHCVLVLCLENDFDDIVSDERYSYPKPQFRLAGDRLELANVPVPRTRAAEYAGGRLLKQSGEIRIGVLNRSHTWNRLIAWRRYSGWKKRQTESADQEGAAGPEMPSADGEAERRKLMAALLGAIRDTCDGRGIQFSVAVIHGREPGPRLQWLTGFLEAGEIPVLAFNQYGSRWRARSLCVDPHLNPHGHELLGEQIAALIGK